MSTTTETGNENFVVLVDKVQTTIAGHEGGDLLAVLDELDTHAFSNGGVGLLGFDPDLLQHDPLGHRRTTHGIGLHGGHGVRLGVLVIAPALFSPMVAKLSTGTDSIGLSHVVEERWTSLDGGGCLWSAPFVG